MLIQRSREIFEKAVSDYKPKAIVMMFSGGDDSLACYHAAKEIGIKFDAVIHGNTRTGIPETTEFARAEVERNKDRYIEADAGTTYEDYVIRKGFFGKGPGAHNFSYHILKDSFFRQAVSRTLRKGRRHFPVLFINGGRQYESENRKENFISPYRINPWKPMNIWVNLINDWSKDDCKNYIDGCGVKRNPVAVNLCRSGECMCGTMQSMGDRKEAAFFYPDWGKWINDLDARIKALHGFGWGEHKTKEDLHPFIPFPSFQPMCVGCTKNEVAEIK